MTVCGSLWPAAKEAIVGDAGRFPSDAAGESLHCRFLYGAGDADGSLSPISADTGNGPVGWEAKMRLMVGSGRGGQLSSQRPPIERSLNASRQARFSRKTKMADPQTSLRASTAHKKIQGS